MNALNKCQGGVMPCYVDPKALVESPGPEWPPCVAAKCPLKPAKPAVVAQLDALAETAANIRAHSIAQVQQEAERIVREALAGPRSEHGEALRKLDTLFKLVQP